MLNGFVACHVEGEIFRSPQINRACPHLIGASIAIFDGTNFGLVPRLGPFPVIMWRLQWLMLQQEGLGRFLSHRVQEV